MILWRSLWSSSVITYLRGIVKEFIDRDRSRIMPSRAAGTTSHQRMILFVPNGGDVTPVEWRRLIACITVSFNNRIDQPIRRPIFRTP